MPAALRSAARGLSLLVLVGSCGARGGVPAVPCGPGLGPRLVAPFVFPAAGAIGGVLGGCTADGDALPGVARAHGSGVDGAA